MGTSKKISIGCDHGGFSLKEDIKKHLSQNGVDVIDVGTDSIKSVDYPDYAAKAVSEVINGNAGLGIVICRSGIGMSMSANRFKGIRAALCTSEIMAVLSRKHNNANVLALGSDIIPHIEAMKIVDSFINTEFEGDRHTRRVDMMDNLQ